MEERRRGGLQQQRPGLQRARGGGLSRAVLRVLMLRGRSLPAALASSRGRGEREGGGADQAVSKRPASGTACLSPRADGVL